MCETRDVGTKYGLEVEDEISTIQYWGRRRTDREMESRAERSLDEADSRGSNVETGKEDQQEQ